MGEIEVNEYVRTKDGIIDKVIIEYDGKCNNSNCDEKHISCKYNYYNEKDIVKHSKQLIDLIETGDYVNGHLVEEVRISCFSSSIFVHEYEIELHENDIKTILTKEQMKANCYKVGGEDE